MKNKFKLLISLAIILLVGTGTFLLAFKNTGTYIEEERTMVIKESVFDNAILAEVKLISPDVVHVIRGKDRMVAEFEINNVEKKYSKVFTDMKFYDIRNNMKKFDRSFTYKYRKSLGFKTITDFETICPDEDSSNCYDEIKGTHEEEQFEWVEIDKLKDIPTGKIIIGVFTDVKSNEHVEWVPTLFGVDIDEWATWTESLGEDIIAYYTFDVDGTDVTRGGSDCVEGETAIHFDTGGLIGGFYNFTGVATQNLTCESSNGLRLTENFTISSWTKHAITTSDWVYHMPKQKDVLGYRYGMFQTTGPFAQATLLTGENDKTVVANEFKFNTGNWTMITQTYNGTSHCVWVNGTLDECTAGDKGVIVYGTPLPSLAFGVTNDGSNAAKTGIDEVGIWNRSLSASEVSQLYNAGLGIPYASFVPVITLNDPGNNTIFTVSTVEMNCSATDNAALTNISLIIDGTRNTSINTSEASDELNITLTFGDGNYGWTCEAYDDSDQSGTTGAYQFNVSTIPAIDLIEPTPINGTNLSTTSFITNVSLTETFFSNLTFLLHNSTGEYDKTTFTSSTRFINWSSLPNGNYTYNATTETTTDQKNTTETREIQIDSTIPEINITYPLTTVDYQILNKNLTINFSVLDSHLSSCIGSFDHGVTNISVVCADNNITMNVTSLTNNNTFMLWANDTFGNSANSSRTWNHKVFQIATSYSPSTTEGATETFMLNFTQGAGLQTSTVNLIYNSSAYASTFSVSSGNVTVSNSIAIPNKDSQLLIPFYWNIIMSDASEINTSSQNQSVDILQIDDCTSYTNLIYNYTVYNEETKVMLENTTIEIQLGLYDSSKTLRILNFSQSYSETNPARICMQGSLLTTVNYSIDSVVRYTSNDSGNLYAIEHYNLLRHVLSNITVPNNIDLYDLLGEDSTEFQLTFKDDSLAFAPNILVHLYRQYIADNDFKIVEAPLTDSNGQTILHMVRNDVIYNILFVDQDGDIIASFNKMTAFCQDYTIGSCTINLDARSATDIVYDYESDLGMSYTTPTYSNSTNLVSFNFVSDDLTPKTVFTRIIKNSDFGNRTVCENSLTSATGLLTCDVSGVTATDRFLFIDIYVDGDLQVQSTIDLESDSLGFGTANGAFFAFLILLFIITMFMEDKQVLIVALVIGWTVVIALGLLNGALIGAVSGGIWLIICAIIFIWKLKKEEVG